MQDILTRTIVFFTENKNVTTKEFNAFLELNGFNDENSIEYNGHVYQLTKETNSYKLSELEVIYDENLGFELETTVIGEWPCA